MHFILQLFALTISPSLGSWAPNKAGRSSSNNEVKLLYCSRNKYRKPFTLSLQEEESYPFWILIKVRDNLPHRYRHVLVKEPVRCIKTLQGHSIELSCAIHYSEPSFTADGSTELQTKYRGKWQWHIKIKSDMSAWSRILKFE